MDSGRLRAEQLLTLSSAARRVADLVAVAHAPVHYEVLRHLLRVGEETMIEVLEEAVNAGLVRRGADAFTYVPFDDGLREEIAGAMDEERRERLRRQIESATARVFE